MTVRPRMGPPLAASRVSRSNYAPMTASTTWWSTVVPCELRRPPLDRVVQMQDALARDRLQVARVAARRSSEKARIGRAAAELVGDGAVVGMTGGTTTLELVRALSPRRGITVVTNAINIAADLMGHRRSTLPTERPRHGRNPIARVSPSDPGRFIAAIVLWLRTDLQDAPVSGEVPVSGLRCKRDRDDRDR